MREICTKRMDVEFVIKKIVQSYHGLLEPSLLTFVQACYCLLELSLLTNEVKWRNMNIEVCLEEELDEKLDCVMFCSLEEGGPL